MTGFRKLKGKIAIVSAVALLGVTGLETVASAHVREANSDTNINYSFKKEKFKGRVQSGWKRCKRNRDVQVWKKRDGDDRLIGTDVSNDGGYWGVTAPDPDGKYYAVVVYKQRSKPHHKHICKRGESEVIEVHT